MAKAVSVGDVLKQPLAVQNVVLDLLVMGKDVDIRQAQAGREAGEVRGGFALFLRLNVDHISGVHASRADADHHPGIILQQLPQADLLEKGILGGNMASGQQNQVAVFNEPLGVLLVEAVQDVIALEGHSLQGKSPGGIRGKTAGAAPVFRVSGNEQRPGIGGQYLADPVDKVVGVAEKRPVRVIDIGTAGNEQYHKSFLLKISRRGSIPPRNPPCSPGRIFHSDIPGNRRRW